MEQEKVTLSSIGGKKAYINGIVFIALNYNEGYDDEEFRERFASDLVIVTLAETFKVSDKKVMNDVIFARNRLAQKGAYHGKMCQ